MKTSAIVATNKTFNPLSIDDLKNIVPAAFQTKPHARMSNRYQFINTMDVVEKFIDAGFLPYSGNQINFRKETSLQGYQFHKVTLFHPDMVVLNSRGQVDEYFNIEILNSHNGYSKFALHGSFYRLACDNGMLALSNDLGHIVTRHTGENLAISTNEIIEKMAEQFEIMMKSVKKMKATQLSKEKQITLASKMAEIRAFKQKGKYNYNAEQLLTPLREQDKGNSLWKTYNVVQEKLIKGYNFDGGRVASEEDKKAARKLRAINHMKDQIDLNKAFFNEALAMM